MIRDSEISTLLSLCLCLHCTFSSCNFFEISNFCQKQQKETKEPKRRYYGCESILSAEIKFLVIIFCRKSPIEMHPSEAKIEAFLLTSTTRKCPNILVETNIHLNFSNLFEVNENSREVTYGQTHIHIWYLLIVI